MANDIPTGSEQSLTTLVSGIINDAETLMKQEVALAKTELKEEMKKTKEALVSLAVGAGVAALGGLMLTFMVVHLITWVSSNAIPLWVSYAIVGGVLAVTGAVLVFTGTRRAEDIHLVPPQTAQTMRENVQWIKNQT